MLGHLGNLAARSDFRRRSYTWRPDRRNIQSSPCGASQVFPRPPPARSAAPCAGERRPAAGVRLGARLRGAPRLARGAPERGPAVLDGAALGRRRGPPRRLRAAAGRGGRPRTQGRPRAVCPGLRTGGGAPRGAGCARLLCALVSLSVRGVSACVLACPDAPQILDFCTLGKSIKT